MIDDHYIELLLKCYIYLQSTIESKVVCANQTRDVEYDLDIFKQTLITSELAIELVTREMLIFRCYQVNSKEFKCLLQWWAKHEVMFFTIGFLA
jgi:hypothetical protein